MTVNRRKANGGSNVGDDRIAGFKLVAATPALLTTTPYKIDAKNKLVAPSITGNCEPGGTITWYTNGPQGAQVKIRLARLSGSGGHNHDGGGPTGTISPSSFTLRDPYPQNVRSIFRAPEACGTIRQKVAVGGGPSIIGYNDVLISGLTALPASTGLTLTGKTTRHPSNHWGTPDLVQALRALGRAYYLEFQTNLFINDMSLQTGGLFDIQGAWAPPHQTHRTGRDVDINRSSMTSAQRTFFTTTAESLEFRVELHPPNPPHWHLTK